MDKCGQRSTVDDQPGDEGTKLFWGEEVDLEHADGMGTKRPIPDSVDAEFRDYNRC